MTFGHPNISHSSIPSSRNDLFSSLWRAAHWVWRTRHTAKQTKFPFSEETITETILLELGTNNAAEVTIIPFNKRQEGNIGADWEWCFYDRSQSQYQQLLVQAKLLDDTDTVYSHIDRYIGDSGVLQIDRFLSTSIKRRVPAIYVFYNSLDNPNRIPNNNCGTFKEAEVWGCSMALASAVKTILPIKTFDSLKRFSKPLVCILCQNLNGATAPEKVVSALNELSERAKKAIGESFAEVSWLPTRPSAEPPRYFEQLANAEGAISTNLIEKVAAENPELDGVVLVTGSVLNPSSD